MTSWTRRERDPLGAWVVARTLCSPLHGEPCSALKCVHEQLSTDVEELELIKKGLPSTAAASCLMNELNTTNGFADRNVSPHMKTHFCRPHLRSRSTLPSSRSAISGRVCQLQKTSCPASTYVKWLLGGVAPSHVLCQHWWRSLLSVGTIRSSACCSTVMRP